MLGAPGGYVKNMFAEPYGVEGTCGAILHVRHSVGSAPNKRAQTRGNTFQKSGRYALAMAYFAIWAKKRGPASGWALVSNSAAGYDCIH